MLKKLLISVMALITAVGMMNVSAAYVPEFSVWDGSIDTSWAENYDSDSIFTIETAAQLAGLRNLVWEGKNFANKLIRLNANIDLNNLNWKYGIGGRKDSSWGENTNLQFKGEIRGNGYIIKNLSINPNLSDASEESGNNVSDDVLGQNICYGFLGYTSSGTVGGINLENVSVTFPNTQKDMLYQIGGLAGFTADTVYSACTVKNIKFCGGWFAYAGTPCDLNIGGLIGDMNSGTVNNCYTNGVDYTTMKNGRINSRAYKSGLLCVSTSSPTINNSYAVNMKYDRDGKTELWTDYWQYNTRNFDTFVYCRKNGDSSYHTFKTNGKVYTDNYDHRREEDLVSGAEDKATAAVFGENFDFAPALKGEGDNAKTVYTMIDLSEYGIKYPVTGAEKIFAVKPVFYSNGAEIDTLEDAGSDLTVKFKSYNTTGQAQSFDLIEAGYTDGKLADVHKESVSLSKNVPVTEPERWEQWQPYVYGKTAEELAVSQETEGEVSAKADGINALKVFCWESMESQQPIALGILK